MEVRVNKELDLGVAIFIGTKIATQIKFKLDNRCSNNQAEQLAIIKALETIGTISIEESNPHTPTVYTDSRLTIDSIRNPDNHAYLIEEIRRSVAKLQGSNWKIEFIESIQRWQKEWENCTKTAITKQYFPMVQERLTTKVTVTQNIAAMMTGHGKTRAYLHRFKILGNATRACEQGEQTIDHLLYHCTLLETQRQTMKKNAIKAS